MKTIIIMLVVLAIIGGGFYFIKKSGQDVVPNVNTGVSTSTPQVEQTVSDSNTIGKSAGGKDIGVVHYGNGSNEILVVGGIHGGYSWNTSLLAYQLSDYLKTNESSIPKSVKVTIVPVLNPDGLERVVGRVGSFSLNDVSTSAETLVAGRFNANNVDINRNFDCDWKATGKWQNKNVSGGSSVFSEPESQALKQYIEVHKPKAVIALFSSAGGVYASSCGMSVSTETGAITNMYAKASGYPAFQKFDYYETSGDMPNWLAKNNIPAISVLLTNHTDTEFDKNKNGLNALIEHYSK